MCGVGEKIFHKIELQQLSLDYNMSMAQKLCNAARDGDMGEATRLLNRGADVNVSKDGKISIK